MMVTEWMIDLAPAAQTTRPLNRPPHAYRHQSVRYDVTRRYV